MTDLTQEQFRVSWRSPLAIGYFACAFVATAWAWPETSALIAIGSVAAFGLALLLFVPVVSVGDSGIVLYRVNVLPWSRVQAARRVTFLGLPYLLVERHNGFRWWLPLYVQGKRTLADSLADRAPADNPLAGAL